MNDEQRAKLIKLAHDYAYAAVVLSTPRELWLDIDESAYARAREAFEDLAAKL
jgi:predicted kinase